MITIPRFNLGTSLINVRKVTTYLSCSVTGNKLDLGKGKVIPVYALKAYGESRCIVPFILTTSQH